MPENNSKTYIIFLDLPKDTEQAIDVIRKKYSPNSFKKWKAHFTLKYDEDFANEPRLIKLVGDFCSKLKPVELELGKIKTNRNKGWNIYIEVIREPELIRTIHKLAKTISPLTNHWELSRKFYPHISLKGGLDPAEADRFLKKFSQEKLIYPNKIRCRSITLARWENDYWRKVKTFKLRNKNE